MNKSISIFWFRQDLRLSDNPGLREASGLGQLLPIYILDDIARHLLKRVVPVDFICTIPWKV
jgi:deoxyribodipyrimidine photolyase